MTTLSSEIPATLYRHACKHEWGLALLAWEHDGRRAYQFEDGTLRVFKEGYYRHFESVDAPADRLAALVAMMGGHAPATTRAAAPDPLAFTLEEQIDYFLATYPGGFEGETWRSAFRHGKSGRMLKRHRDAAVETARDVLSQQALEAFVDQRREHDGIEALSSLLRSTDLVPVASVRPLAGVRGAVAGALIGRLRDLLWESELGSGGHRGLRSGCQLGAGHGTVGAGPSQRSCVRSRRELSGPGDVDGAPASLPVASARRHLQPRARHGPAHPPSIGRASGARHQGRRSARYTRLHRLLAHGESLRRDRRPPSGRGARFRARRRAVDHVPAATPLLQ
jgi:hypothetical protein